MTKRPLLAAILALAAAAGALAAHPAIAQTGAPPGGTATPQREAAPEEPQQGTAVVYRPPLRGAPGGRVGGASRGAIRPPAPLPTIELLAPDDHAGQTISATPTLYYFVSRPVSWPMQLTIRAPLRSRYKYGSPSFTSRRSQRAA